MIGKKIVNSRYKLYNVYNIIINYYTEKIIKKQILSELIICIIYIKLKLLYH